MLSTILIAFTVSAVLGALYTPLAWARRRGSERWTPWAKRAKRHYMIVSLMGLVAAGALFYTGHPIYGAQAAISSLIFIIVPVGVQQILSSLGMTFLQSGHATRSFFGTLYKGLRERRKRKERDD